ncbi:LexA/Signal peptidase [Pleurotus eryngii]|uniref:LexA/Signal peptidase n=1 Tax=Pleurotus eryngii TaxID=5323 RepID=A0A9P6A6B4_PLEER|nr:LexA/Signal peptidase [Pleurotus eryngii]
MACALHIFAEYVGTVSLMSGLSMMPTLADSGEIVVEDRLSIRWNPTGIARGDLITLYSPLDPSRIICKRVIGLPGDVVCVDPTGQKAPSTEHVVIPKGHLWISGDNAAMSRDSRDYGPVSMSLVRAKLRARVRFLDRTSTVAHLAYIQIYPDITIFRNPITYLD